MVDQNDNISEKTPIFLHPARRLDLFARGQDLFNDEKFFEAHELWEELWLAEQGRDRTFIQALIQVAGFFVHLQKGNWSGARSLADLAREKLRVPPVNKMYLTLDVTALVSAIDYNLKTLGRTERGETPAYSEFLVPKLLGK